MREYIQVQGGNVLSGSVNVSGAKNAVLPMLIASLLTDEEVIFKNVPLLRDVVLTKQLLESFGAEVHSAGDEIRIKVPELLCNTASYSLVKTMRASFWVLGPILARAGEAHVAMPGGDLIGARPVDLHLEGLTAMGAEVQVKNGVVHARAPKGLKPADYRMRFPSVGATHQLLLAASLIEGETVLRNCAQEPEVSELARLLSKMGAQIDGIDTDTLIIRGAKRLHGAEIEIIGDRIEAATYLLAAAATYGKVRVNKITPAHLGEFLPILSDMDLSVETGTDYVTVRSFGRIKPVKVKTAPFPGFATDIQAQLMATLTLAEGQSEIEENIFEGRFAHAGELCRMGADIKIEGRLAIINGVSKLSAAPVEGNDIRGAVALVIAALNAEGVSEIYEPQHLRRGYSNLEGKLISIGAKIGLRLKDAEDYLFAGC
jgi:UDP-N-acetylglucosamine 1-carboxyvinyltransferase